MLVKGLLAVLFAVTVQFSSCSSPCHFSEFFYDYESEVQVGIEDVGPVSSLYKLKGQLIVKTNYNSSSTSKNPTSGVTFQFRDLKYQQYHGNLEKKENQKHYESAPLESSNLNMPFDVFYSDGLFKKMNTHGDEIGWSVNMKRAIANTFQLKSIEYIKKEKQFGISEASVYGYCRPEYSSSTTDSGLMVTKVYFADLCESPYIHSVDVEQSSSRKGSNLFENFNGMKKYKVNTKDFKHPVIESIETSETMHDSDFGSYGEKRSVITKQKFRLQQSQKYSAQIAFNCEMKEDEVQVNTIHDLKYYQTLSENPFGLLHVTNGRSKFQGSTHQEKVIEKLHEAVSHLEKNHLTGSFKEISQHQIVNELLAYLRYLNSEEIKNIYGKITSGSTKKEITARNLFFEIIPIAGTKSSINFILDLLKKDKVIDEGKMENILMEMPFYVLNYTKEIIDEAQALLNLAESASISKDIQGTAILTFSTMFGQFCSKARKNSASCDSNTISTMAEYFFNKIIENEGNYYKQLVYIEGLKNLNVNEAVDYLERIITKKDVNMRDELRLRALMSPHLLTKLSSSKVDKIFLPVLKNIHEPVELRAAALQMVMDYELEQPNYRPFNLHWYMTGETSDELYNYYYTLLKSYAYSVNPQHENKKSAATKILKVSRKPSSLTRLQSKQSNAWMYNYISKPYGFGGELIFRTVGSGRKALPTMLYTEYNSMRGTGRLNEFGIFIRMKGLEDLLMQYILNDMRFPSHQSQNDVLVTEPAHFEAIIQRQGYSCSVLYDGEDSDNNSESSFTSLWYKLLNFNEQMIFYNKLTDKTYITDMGIPVVLNVHYPFISSAIGKFDWKTNKIKVDVSFRVEGAGGTNLMAFNPISNAWHGVSRIHSSDLQLPISAEFSYDWPKKSFEFTLQRTDGDGHIGFQMAAKTYSGIFSGDSALPEIITEVVEYSRKPMLHSYFENMYDVSSFNSEHLGYEFSVGSTDINLDDSVLSYISSGNLASINGFESDSLLKKWTQYSLMSNYLEYLPAPGNHSFRIVAAPRRQNSGSKFSITMEVKGNEITPRPLPGYKFNLLTKVHLSESTENSKTFSIDTDYESAPNGITTSIKSKVSTLINGVTQGKPFTFDFAKTYPPLGKDSFQYGWGDEKVTTTVGFKSCLNDDTNDCQAFDLVVSGEISDEQKQIASSDAYPYGQCKLDKQKPEWQGPLYPRTWACFEGAIKLFYTRKVTFNLATKNLFIDVPSFIEGRLLKSYGKYLYRVKVLKEAVLSKENEQKMSMEVIHSATKPMKNIELATQTGVYKFKFIPGVDKDIFNIQLDNTHFSKFVQILEASGFDKSCVVSVASVLNPNNLTVDHSVGSEYETLSELTGSGKYGVYAKKTSVGLGVKVVVGDGVLELSGSTATLNGKPVPNIEQGYQYPPNEPNYYIRIWSNQGQITFYSRRLGVYGVYSPVSLTLDQPIILKGFVKGLCGNLRGETSSNKYPHKEVEDDNKQMNSYNVLGMTVGHILNTV